jgi:hypothetical protein
MRTAPDVDQAEVAIRQILGCPRTAYWYSMKNPEKLATSDVSVGPGGTVGGADTLLRTGVVTIAGHSVTSWDWYAKSDCTWVESVGLESDWDGPSDPTGRHSLVEELRLTHIGTETLALAAYSGPATKYRFVYKCQDKWGNGKTIGAEREGYFWHHPSLVVPARYSEDVFGLGESIWDLVRIGASNPNSPAPPKSTK